MMVVLKSGSICGGGVDAAEIRDEECGTNKEWSEEQNETQRHHPLLMVVVGMMILDLPPTQHQTTHQAQRQ